MKVYCPDCGAGTEYSLKKPKFCGACGKSFSTASVPAKRVFKTNPQNITSTVQEEVEEEEFQAPSISKLDFILESSNANNVYKLEDIAGSHPGAGDDGYVREADSSYTTESIKNDFMRDAGLSRRDDAET